MNGSDSNRSHPFLVDTILFRSLLEVQTEANSDWSTKPMFPGRLRYRLPDETDTSACTNYSDKEKAACLLSVQEAPLFLVVVPDQDLQRMVGGLTLDAIYQAYMIDRSKAVDPESTSPNDSEE